MAELFVELFSEEIPSKLQVEARQKIKQMINERLEKKRNKFYIKSIFLNSKKTSFFYKRNSRKNRTKKKDH